MKKKKQDNKGFTLIELVIVVAILAILIGILAPQYTKYVEKARKAADASNMDEMVKVIKVYAADPANEFEVGDYAITISATGTELVTKPTGKDETKYNKDNKGDSGLAKEFGESIPSWYDTKTKSQKWGKDGKVKYSMGASILIAGQVIQWLRDKINLVDHAAKTSVMAESIPDNGGIFFVPAFTGLGAPHWNTGARGMIIGITAATSKEQITRAALESMAYQTRDLLEEMERNSGIKLKELKVDGGASKNDFLMQFQADILNCRVVRPKDIETTALGACYLAGLGCGIFKSEDEIKELWEADRVFEPQMDEETRENLYAQWCKAVEKSKDWL